MTWFEQLFGFPEGPYEETQARFALEGETLVAHAPEGVRRFGVGRFATPSLGELREAARGLRPGRLRVTHEAIGDVLELHGQAENAGALFQAASQLNCLEFASPSVVPEDGITGYASDPTQGPACSLACAAATAVRNYLVPVDGAVGQRRNRQINTLAEVQALLGEAGALLDVRNGYSFSSPDRLDALNQALTERDRDALLGALRIGVHAGVEVTFGTRFAPPPSPQRVSQAFCSALSCGYSPGSSRQWEPLATVVLDGAYEATLLAAVLDAAEGAGSGRVWLTFLGGGVFRNDPAWIHRAIGRALRLCRDRDLDVRIAHYRRIDGAARAAVDAATG
jgi:hypothetical protein